MQMAGLIHKVIILMFICICVPSLLAKPVKYCDKKGNKYAVKVKGIEMNPDPVKAGKPVTFSLYATSGQDLNGGKVEISVSYFGIHVHSQADDLCEKTICPVQSGNFVISHSQTLPPLTPPGQYTLRMRILDGSNGLLTCINFDFKIAFGETAYDS